MYHYLTPIKIGGQINVCIIFIFVNKNTPELIWAYFNRKTIKSESFHFLSNKRWDI